MQYIFYIIIISIIILSMCKCSMVLCYDSRMKYKDISNCTADFPNLDQSISSK